MVLCVRGHIRGRLLCCALSIELDGVRSQLSVRTLLHSRSLTVCPGMHEELPSRSETEIDVSWQARQSNEQAIVLRLQDQG